MYIYDSIFRDILSKSRAMSGQGGITLRRSSRAPKPKKFEGFEVKTEKVDYSYGDVQKPGEYPENVQYVTQGWFVKILTTILRC